LDFWMTDADGSLRPAGFGSGQGTLVAKVDRLLHFVSPLQCREDPANCMSYCNTCFRSVVVSMKKQPIPYKLKVCRANNLNDCTYFNSYRTTNNPGNGETRVYANLPPGSYVGRLETARGRFATVDYSVYMTAPACTGGLQETDFSMVEAPLSAGSTPALRATPPSSMFEYDEDYTDDFVDDDAVGIEPGDDDFEPEAIDGDDFVPMDFDDDSIVEEVAEGTSEPTTEEMDDVLDDVDAEAEEEDEEEEESKCKGLFCGSGNK